MSTQKSTIVNSKKDSNIFFVENFQAEFVNFS